MGPAGTPGSTGPMGPTGGMGPTGPQGPQGEIRNIDGVEPVGSEDSDLNVVIGLAFDPQTKQLQFIRNNLTQMLNLYYDVIE